MNIKEYVKAESLAQAYELNQKKSNQIIGGMMWLRMSDRNLQTAIGLEGLGLDKIEETEEEFIIGATTTLHQLECHEGLQKYTNGALKESIRHIVGVQFRNLATIGGSIYGRFGFSDLLTMLLSLETEVELYPSGRIPLTEFCDRKPDNEILTHIIIQKEALRCAYQSFRNTQTDFPVLACAVSLAGEELRVVLGARPGRAVRIPMGILTDLGAQTAAGSLTDCFAGEKAKETEIERLAQGIAEKAEVGGNMRASKEYRQHLAYVLSKRALTELFAEGGKNGCR